MSNNKELNHWREVGKENLTAAIRWLQIKELKLKFPNDQDFGEKVRQIINEDEKRN